MIQVQGPARRSRVETGRSVFDPLPLVNPRIPAGPQSVASAHLRLPPRQRCVDECAAHRSTGRGKPENHLSNCSPADDALGESTSTRRLHIFYEPACQVSSLVVAASYLQRQTSSERAQAPQPARGCARERLFNSDSIVKRSVAARLIPARPLILLFALSCGTLSCRRTIRSEGAAALSVGRLSRAAKCPRALAPPA